MVNVCLASWDHDYFMLICLQYYEKVYWISNSGTQRRDDGIEDKLNEKGLLSSDGFFPAQKLYDSKILPPKSYTIE